MIHIARVSGHPLEAWTFDGRWLRPAGTLRPPALLEGFDLEEVDGAQGRRWRFNGRDLHVGNEVTPSWIFEEGVLRKNSGTQVPWTFDGRVLQQSGLDRADRWEADGEVPLLVAAFAAGLL